MLETVVYFNLRLDRDLEIRIQRKLGSDTTTSILAFQSCLKFTAEVESAVFISASRLEVVTSFSGHPSSGYGSYRLHNALYTSKYAMKCYTSPN